MVSRDLQLPVFSSSFQLWKQNLCVAGLASRGLPWFHVVSHGLPWSPMGLPASPSVSRGLLGSPMVSRGLPSPVASCGLPGSRVFGCGLLGLRFSSIDMYCRGMKNELDRKSSLFEHVTTFASKPYRPFGVRLAQYMLFWNCAWCYVLSQSHGSLFRQDDISIKRH